MKVSVVIPTTGRPTVTAAVESVLAQRFTGDIEVLVVADMAGDPQIPRDPRIQALRVGPRAGANVARQHAVDRASGDLVAFLDDDDTWHPDKLTRQIDHVRAYVDITGHTPWVAATCATVTTDSGSEIWPRRVIGPHEDFAKYIFRLRSLRMGASFLQTSSLLMPLWIVRDVVRFEPCQRVHQDLGWVLDFRERYPTAPILQTPEALVDYRIASDGISRRFAIDDSMRFGFSRLSDRKHLLADFLLTFPVERAAADSDHAFIRHMLREATRIGCPSRFALCRAMIKYVQAVRRSRAETAIKVTR
ncbi:MAG: glycosyltransferase [Gordonia polyisoprenivorans]|nr:glycosyltransferase [Gordonia polyisoprenivorans]